MMKTRTKKLTTLLLTAVMTASFAACGNSSDTGKQTDAASEAASNTSDTADSSADNSAEDLYYNTEGFPIVKEPITIELSGITGTTQDWQNTHIVKKIEELMGIRLECTTYADSNTWNTQFATMMASDNLPDLITQISVSKTMTNEYGADGYLLDISDYLHLMPNFSRFLEENPEYAAYHTTEDGSIYSFDRVRPVDLPQVGLYVSKADQEKYGFSVEDIKTTEDFYEVLKSIKEQNPDAIPLSLTFDGQCGQRGTFTIRNAFGIYSMDQNNLLGVDDQGQVILYDITDNNKAYLEYMNRLWKENLLDQESFIMSSDEYRSKIRNGEVVFWHDWAYLATGVQAEDAGIYQEYDSLLAMTSEYNDTATYVMAPPYNASARVMVSANTEYPEAVCRLLDYVFSEEGQIFFSHGTEGETFEYIDDGMGNMIPNHDNFWDQTKYSSQSEWLYQEVSIGNAFEIVIPSDSLAIVKAATDDELNTFIYEDPSYQYTADAHTELALRKQVEVRRYPSFLPVPYSTEESDALSQPNTDMSLLLQQYKAQFITGKLDIDTAWDSYKEQINVFWNQIQPVIQGAYDRANK